MKSNCFMPGNIVCDYNSTRVHFSREQRIFIEKIWNKEKKSKPFIFNGYLFHTKEIKYNKNNKTIHIYLCKSSFKDYTVTNTMSFKKKFSLAPIVRPLSVGTIIITSDRKWLIGKRKGTSDYNGYFSLIAGYMDPLHDIVRGKPDPFYAIRREIREETGILDKDIDNIECIGLVRKKVNPYLSFITRLNLSHKKILSSTPIEQEFEEVKVFELGLKTIRNFMRKNRHIITPSSYENLMMFIYKFQENNNLFP